VSDAEDFRAWVDTLPPTEGTVRVEPGRIATVWLDAPRTRNALTPAMMVRFGEAADALRDARAVILRGAAGTFCSGGDLDAVRAWLAVPGMGRRMGRWMHAATEAFEALRVPIVGVLEGAAMGGGAELLALCDHVVAAPDARVGWVQSRLGVRPGFGGETRLVRRIGAEAAARIIDAGMVLPAAEALACGVVDAVADPPADAARHWAETCASDPRRAARVVSARGIPCPDAAAAELARFDACWGHPAHRRALGLDPA
jgi:enoyl-CoA hydratase/carnithine racemase